MTWIVLALLWIVAPFLYRDWVPLDALHLVVVALFALAAAAVAWRRSTVPVGLPWLATGVACASLLVASLVDPQRFPVVERVATAHTGWAHGLFFLAALVVVPPRGDGPADETALRYAPRNAEARGARFMLVVLLTGLVVSQAVLMVPQIQAGERPSGSLGNPNILGATLGAVALGVAAWSRWRLPALVPLSGLFALVLATRSRGAVAAVTVVLVLLALRRSGKAVLLVLLAAAVVLLIVPNPVSERLAGFHDDHVYGRAFFYEVALENIADHPAGIGAGMNRFVFPPRAFVEEAPWLLHQRHAVGLTHNVLLTLTLEWGWAAGLAAVALLVATLRRLLAVRGDPDALGQGAAVAGAVLFLEAQVDGLEQNPVVFALLLFLGAVVWIRAPKPAGGIAVPGRVVALVLAVAGVLLGVRGLERGSQIQALTEAGIAADAWRAGSGDPAEVDALFAEAERLAPGDARPSTARFLFLEERLRRGLVEDGAPPETLVPLVEAGWAALARAEAADPADPWLARCRARYAIRLYRHGNRAPELLELYFQAMVDLLARDPLDVRARWEVAQEASRVGRRDLMEHHCRALFAYEPDDARSWFTLAVLRELDGDLEGAASAYQRTVEAVYNARVKLGVGNPASQAYYQERLEGVDVQQVKARQYALRRRLYG